jgi:hypothetical protein
LAAVPCAGVVVDNDLPLLDVLPAVFVVVVVFALVLLFVPFALAVASFGFAVVPGRGFVFVGLVCLVVVEEPGAGVLVAPGAWGLEEPGACGLEKPELEGGAEGADCASTNPAQSTELSKTGGTNLSEFIVMTLFKPHSNLLRSHCDTDCAAAGAAAIVLCALVVGMGEQE